LLIYSSTSDVSKNLIVIMLIWFLNKG